MTQATYPGAGPAGSGGRSWSERVTPQRLVPSRATFTVNGPGIQSSSAVPVADEPAAGKRLMQ